MFMMRMMINKTLMISNDSKFCNVNRNICNVGNFLELYCSPIDSYFSTYRLRVLHTVDTIQAVSQVCHDVPDRTTT